MSPKKKSAKKTSKKTSKHSPTKKKSAKKTAKKPAKKAAKKPAKKTVKKAAKKPPVPTQEPIEVTESPEAKPEPQAEPKPDQETESAATKTDSAALAEEAVAEDEETAAEDGEAVDEGKEGAAEDEEGAPKDGQGAAADGENAPQAAPPPKKVKKIFGKPMVVEAPADTLLTRTGGLPFDDLTASKIKVAQLLDASVLPWAFQASMVPDAERELFREAVAEQSGLGGEIVRAFEVTFGWRPPAEFGVWLELEAGAHARNLKPEDLSGWMVGLDLCRLDEDTRNRRNYFAWANGDGFMADPIGLFTGLFRFGMDASGDTAFACLLPHAQGLVEVLQCDHESGSLDGFTCRSISGFFLEHWLNEEHPDAKSATKLIASLTRKTNTERKKRKTYLRARQMFERTEWLWAMLMQGREPYGFGELMGRAPTFAQWEAEQDLCTEGPHLANYWAMAHWFLQNDGACREALAMARKTQGQLTLRVADVIGRLLDGARLDLGNLPGYKLDAMRRLVRKNITPEHLPAKARAALRAERGESKVRKLTRKQGEQAMTAGQDPFELITAHPKDVATHDRALAKAAEGDAALAQLVKAYLKERKGDTFNNWPRKSSELDPRLSLPISAAFRSGLGYEHTHKLAFAGITRTLAKFDDDHTMNAWEEALKRLVPADNRLEYVIAGLAESKHERRLEVLRMGAWRFFDELARTSDLMSERAARHPTLDDMFAVDDHLAQALCLALQTIDEDVDGLARKVLSMTSSLMALKTAWACALQVAVTRGLTDQATRALVYCQTVCDKDWGEQSLSADVVINLAESALALYLLDPIKAKDYLPKLYADAAANDLVRIQIAGGLIAGLLPMRSKDPQVLSMLERVLGNRNRERGAQVYGALRGIEQLAKEGTQLQKAIEWVRPHILDGYSGLNKKLSPIGQAAQDCLTALGETDDPPKFDSKAYYGRGLTDNQLLKALSNAAISAEHVLKRIRKEGLRLPKASATIGSYLEDQLRFSADLRDPYAERHHFEALGALLVQGPAALPHLAKLLDLPQLHSEWAGPILQTMRYIQPEQEIRDVLEKRSAKSVLEYVRKPDPRYAGWLDLMAAWVALDGSPAALQAVSAACTWRFRHLDQLANRDDMLAQRLPYILASFGERARPDFDRFAELTNGYESKACFSRGELALAEWEEGSLPVDHFESQDNVALAFSINGAQDKYRLELTIQNGPEPTVELHSREKDLAFRGWVDAIECRKSYPCADLEQARVLAGKLLRQALITGFRPS